MKRHPKRAKYRNLSARTGSIYYERVWNGQRHCFSTKTTDWDMAASVRDLYEEKKGIGKTPFFAGEIPKFETFTQRYLDEDTSHLAPTTRKDRRSYLREDGPLLGYFGQRKLDNIYPALLREWWNQEVLRAGRSTRTGRAYLDVLSSVLAYAIDLEILETNPVPAFRETLRRRSNTKRGRSESETGRHVRPIETAEEIGRLLKASQEEGLPAHVLVLLLLDAGLRLGEAIGLRWGKVGWGVDEDDLSRALLIDEARPRGGEPAPPKSGRDRTIALSKRLRHALAALYRGRFEPTPSALVLEGIEPNNFRQREWRRILKRAGIGHLALKDLRDTFASQLLTAGVQLGYVSVQLGHSDVAVTAQHYARWIGGSMYRDPMRLRTGEVPADLLARLGDESQRSPKTSKTDAEPPIEKQWNYGQLLVGAAGFEPATFSSQS